MTKRQKKLAKIWFLVVVFISAFSFAGYAILMRGEFTQGDGSGAVEPVKTLEDVIASRQSWDLEFTSWTGKPTGDLVVKDISGKIHKLSDFKGNNVLVVFWATWCPACNAEIPHLIKLRDKFGPEKLQILAVSNESETVLKAYVEAKNINYTVATFSDQLPDPFNGVTGIPTSFFIDPDGKLKLAAIGLVSLEDSLAILNATK